jgi:hypothetical protein
MDGNHNRALTRFLRPDRLIRIRHGAKPLVAAAEARSSATLLSPGSVEKAAAREFKVPMQASLGTPPQGKNTHGPLRRHGSAAPRAQKPNETIGVSWKRSSKRGARFDTPWHVFTAWGIPNTCPGGIVRSLMPLSR